MPSTYDPLLRLDLQAINENSDTWGNKLNDNYTLLAQAVAGYSSVSIAGSGTYTLSVANAPTPDEARKAFLNFTGILTGAKTIIIPSSSKVYFLRLSTTGNYPVTVKTATGAGVILSTTNVNCIVCDGLDCYFASETNRVNRAGDSMTGTLSLPAGTSVSVSQALRSDEVTARVSAIAGPMISAALPSGVITLWSGSILAIPSGWAICDGTGGTPDLRDRFVVGAGSTYAVGDTGGSNTVALTADQIPSHTHTFSATTDSQGSHTHTATTDSQGSHTHYTAGTPGGAGGGIASSWQPGNSNNYILQGGAPDYFITSTAGAHTHTITVASAGAHTHSISGTTGATGGGNAHENRPPYYALAYIMKL